jgi:hypothetical protein
MVQVEEEESWLCVYVAPPIIATEDVVVMRLLVSVTVIEPLDSAIIALKSSIIW